MKKLLLTLLLLAAPAFAKESVFVFDMKHNRVVAKQDETSQRPLASITKLMTAIIAIELGIDDRYLIDTMLVQSNNKSAEKLAAIYGRPQFIHLMNFKAKQLGMNDTKFVDPSGLGMNTSTAVDIAVLIAHATKYAEVRAAASPTVQVVEPKGKRAHLALIQNTNYALLKEFTHITGSKTGFTNAAGWCIAMTTNEHIIVILGSPSKASRNALARRILIELKETPSPTIVASARP